MNTMKNMTQHTASLELSARIDEFRKQFPNDWPRLLEEYAGVGPTGSRDETIAELEELVDTLEGELEEIESAEDTEPLEK